MVSSNLLTNHSSHSCLLAGLESFQRNTPPPRPSHCRSMCHLMLTTVFLLTVTQPLDPTDTNRVHVSEWEEDQLTWAVPRHW